MAERGDPARNHMPSGLLAINTLGDSGRIALAIRRSKRAQIESKKPCTSNSVSVAGRPRLHLRAATQL
jgi:hypothetical protein